MNPSDLEIVSADSHFIEPPNLWVERIAPEFRDRAPRTERGPDGTEYVVCEDVPRLHFQVGSFFGAGRRPEEMPEQYRRGFEAAPKSVWDPAERLKEQDLDGVRAEILYSTECLVLYGIRDTRFLMACFRAFNDWAIEYCRYDPKRLLGIGCLILDDVPAAIAELQRMAKLGLRGTFIPETAPDERPYSSPEYDPFWAAAEELGMVLTFHAGSSRKGVQLNLQTAVQNLMKVPHRIQTTLTDLVVGGALERFPKLRFVSAEFDVSWLPHFLYRLDHSYHKFRHLQDVRLDMKPSDYLKRSLWVTLQFEGSSIRFIEQAIGTEHVLFASDYPHMDSTWPHSRDRLTEVVKDLGKPAAQRIAAENVKALYGFQWRKDP